MWAKMNAKRIAAYRKTEKEKQEKHEHISLLASTRELLRELAYRNGWDASPKQVLSSRVIKVLDKSDIYITEYNYVKGCTDLKPISTLIYEINAALDCPGSISSTEGEQSPSQNQSTMKQYTVYFKEPVAHYIQR